MPAPGPQRPLNEGTVSGASVSWGCARSPVISGLSLVPLVAQSVLGKTCALGKEPGEVLQQGGEYQPSLWALVIVKVSLGLPGLAWGR